MRTYFQVIGIVLLATATGGSPGWAQTAQEQTGQVRFLDGGEAAQTVPLVVGKARILQFQQAVRDVLVANPEVADVVVRTPRLVYVLGRQIGDTNIYFFDSQGNQMLRLEASVDLDLSLLREVLQERLPGEDVKVSAVHDNIMLTGKVSSPKIAEDVRVIARRFVLEDANILNMLEIEDDQQVVLRVRIAEMQRTAIKRLGLAFNYQHDLDPVTGDSIAFGVNTLPTSAIGNVLTTAGTTVLFGASISNALNTFSALVDALESNGLVKTLAEPNLTAISGESANFLAGGEFPIPVAQNEDTITVEFRSFGIGLDFTPVVLSSGQISLRVQTEVSALTTQGQVSLVGFTIPALTVRRAASTVELPSGGSLVIGGLLQDDITETIEGVPGLKDIPILGSLFRSVDFQRNETELVIAVTAYLVEPVADYQIALPTDGFAPASDIDLYLFGRLHATYTKSEALPSLVDLKAPTGYIME